MPVATGSAIATNGSANGPLICVGSGLIEACPVTCAPPTTSTESALIFECPLARIALSSAMSEGPGVGRVVNDTENGSIRGRFPHNLPFVWARPLATWQQEFLPA